MTNDTIEMFTIPRTAPHRISPQTTLGSSTCVARMPSQVF